MPTMQRISVSVMFATIIMILLLSVVSIGAASNESMIVAKLSGFETNRAESLLVSLLGRPKLSEDVKSGTIKAFNMEGLNDSSLLGTTKNTNTSDLSFIFMDNADLMNENMVIARFQDGFAPLLSSRNTSQSSQSNAASMELGAQDMKSSNKRPYIIVYTGSVDTVRQVEFLLRESWALLDRSAYPGLKPTERLFDTLDVQIILTPHYIPPSAAQQSGPQAGDDSEYVNPKAVEAVRKALNTIVTARPVSEVLASCANTANTTAVLSTTRRTTGATTSQQGNANTRTSTSTSGHSNKGAGIAVAQAGIAEGLEWALRSANESIVTLNKLYTPIEGFPQYVNALVKSATAVLREHVANHSSSHVHSHNNINSHTSVAAGGTAAAASTSNTTDMQVKGPVSTVPTVPATTATVPVAAPAAVEVSPAVLRLAEADLAARIFGRLTSIYKLQVQLRKEQITAQFNHMVTEEIPLSVYILEDLQAAKEHILHNFTSCVKRLTPVNAPLVKWNADFEALELARSIDEFISGREEVYRAMGVLPRLAGTNLDYSKEQLTDKVLAALPPTELSVHVLGTQPLVRDYRADPLGVRDTDQVTLKEGGVTASASARGGPRVSAAQARRALKSEVEYLQQQTSGADAAGGTGGVLRSVGGGIVNTLRRLRNKGVLQEARTHLQLRDNTVKSEFAREMMMLPLSLKNPDVQASSGLRRRGAGRRGSTGAGSGASSTGAGAGTGEKGTGFIEGVFEGVLQRRMRLGPERLVRWDVSPMDEVGALLQSQSQPQPGPSAQSMDKLADQALNVIPALKKGYYEHPPLNYGPRYGPSPLKPASASSASSASVQRGN